jgi:hypothetical protein
VHVRVSERERDVERSRDGSSERGSDRGYYGRETRYYSR